MHGDEANQAVKTAILLEDGEYVYDPHDHHGPTLYYLALIPAKLSGAGSLADLTEPMLRVVPAVFGVALILLLWFLRDGLGNGAVVWAAVFTALSPAFVFYSRYYIQEMLLVFFTVAALAAGWRYVVRPHWSKAVLVGACIGLMHATKETAVLAWAVMAAAAFAAYFWERNTQLHGPAARNLIRDAVIAVATAAAVSVTLFSSFFTHARGPLDSILTYGNYLMRADGAGLHDKPWWYYLRLLAYENRGPGAWWSEGLILALAIIGVVVVLMRRTSGHTELISHIDLHSHSERSEESPLLTKTHTQALILRSAQNDRNWQGNAAFLRFLLLYTVLLTLAYTLIPYKTPWSVLSFYHGWILVAGVGASALIRMPRPLWARAAVALLIALGAAHLARQAYRASFELPADPINPYVYAHTSSAHMRLIARLHDLAAIHPDGYNMRVDVVQPNRDYWPLPWYLRQFTAVGYWDAVPERIEAAVVIADPRIRAEVEAALPRDYLLETGVLRPSILRAVYIDRQLWNEFMQDR